MIKYALILFLLVALTFAGFSTVLSQQDKGETKENPQSAVFNKQACMDNFNVSEVDFLNSSMLENNKISKNTLQEFFTCVASAKNDPAQCDKLSPQDAQLCRASYDEELGFAWKLVSMRNAQSPSSSPELVNGCVGAFGYDKKACVQFLEAFKKGDPAICNSAPFNKNSNKCQAIMTLNEGAVSGRDRDTVIYFNALNNLSASDCKRLSNKGLARNCEAFVTGNEKICQQCEGYNKIREIYCSEGNE